MRRIVLLPAVERTLADISRYTREQHGEAQALKYLEGLHDCLERHAQFPQLGRRTSEVSTIRQALYGKHRIFYRETPQGIEIGRILHQRQEFVRVLESYERSARTGEGR